MGVDNKLWAGVEKGYVSTQWCNINGEHLEERWRDRRDDKCPLCRLLNEPIYDNPLIEEEPPFVKDWEYVDNDFEGEPYDKF